MHIEFRNDLNSKATGNVCMSIMYYSQAIKVEMNYYTFKLEMIAIIKATERFHICLYDIEFSND